MRDRVFNAHTHANTRTHAKKKIAKFYFCGTHFRVYAVRKQTTRQKILNPVLSVTPGI